MIRRNFSIAAAGQEEWEEQEAGPMEMVANLTDVMLVLAVALMIALLANWGADFTSITAIEESQLQPLDADMNDNTQSEIADGSTEYEEVGTVYRDSQTGELYVLGN